MGPDWMDSGATVHPKVKSSRAPHVSSILISVSGAFSDDIVRNALWRRLLNAFNYGDLLITIGTGKLTQREEDGTGLVGEHDYAVIDVRECKGQHLFLVKNPWSEGTVWKGRSFLSNRITEISKSLEDVAIADTGSSSGDKSDLLAPGTFWMSLNDVFQQFESIYLNWNPALFPCRRDVHFRWDLSACSSPDGSFVSNPQYAISSQAGGTVWLLLNRHFTSKSQFYCIDRDASPPVESEPGFISLYAFPSDGEKVFISDGAIVHSPYVDSPNTLLKLEVPAKRALTIVVSEQALPRARQSFTLSSFSLAPLHLAEAREIYNHSTWQRGAWMATTAGGNAHSLLYHTNPQFSIRLAKKADLTLLLENPMERLPVHVKLVWGNGRQVHSVTARDIIGDSGEYRKGFAFAKLDNVQAGVYTIVCSTFERGQVGDFVLRVNSTSEITVKRVPVDATGRFVTKVPSAIFTPGTSRLSSPLISQRLNRLSMKARSFGNSSVTGRSIYSPLKISLEYGQGSSKEVFGTSGEDEYFDGRVGVRTPEVNIQQNMCAGRDLKIVIERLACSGQQSDEHVDIEVFSDGPIQHGKWVVGEG